MNSKRYKVVKVANKQSRQSSGSLYRVYDTQWRERMREAGSFDSDYFKYPDCAINWFGTKEDAQFHCDRMNAG